MSDHENLIRVRHIYDSILKIDGFLTDIERSDFDNNEMLRLALIRLIEIIGEAASHITQDYRERYPQIPWVQMIGMRNRLIHAYFDVNENILWDTVTLAIPKLLPDIEACLTNT